jgi:outer membrane protein TolC
MRAAPRLCSGHSWGACLVALSCLASGCALIHRDVPDAPFRQRILPPPVDADSLLRADPPPPPVEQVERCPPPEDRPLTLEEAVAFAWRTNPHLEAMLHRVEQARAGRQVAQADFLPEIRAIHRQVQGVPETTPFVLPTLPTALGNVAFGGMSDRFQTTELQLQWTLWDFGRTAARYGQAAASLAIAELTYQRGRQTVAFNVTAAYFALLQARANRVVAEEAVNRAEAHLRDARNFLKRGTAVRNDVLRAEVQVAEMRLGLVRARTAEAVAVAGLNQAIGFNVSSPTRIADRSEEPAFDLTLPDCLQLAVSNRDEFRVVLQTVGSAQLGVEAARADFLPRIYVAGSRVQLEGNKIKDQILTTGGVSIELNVFEGGRRTGRLYGARAEVAAAVAQGKEVCDQIAYEVDVAYLGIDDARQRIALARSAVASAQENLRVVTGQFRRGDATPTDVVDAELAITRAQQNYYNALYDYQTALARLRYAVGLPLTGDCPADGGR